MKIVDVLVVDDEPGTRRLIAYCGERAGLSIEQAESAEELFAMLAQGVLPGVIVLDAMLPGADGLEILRHLRAERSTSEIPVMLYSGHDAEALARFGWDTSALEVVSKDEPPTELVRRIATRLGRVPDAPPSKPS